MDDEECPGISKCSVSDSRAAVRPLCEISLMHLARGGGKGAALGGMPTETTSEAIGTSAASDPGSSHAETLPPLPNYESVRWVL
jgi:hypothetical protein